MRDLIARGRPDFVCSREMVYDILLPIFYKVTRIPLIIEVNALLDDELKMIGKGMVEIGLVRFCQKINLKSAKGIIAVTEGIRRAFLIFEKYPNLKFVIVGDGIARRGWENMVKDTVITESFLFTGYKPYDLISYYINAFDICVAPTKSTHIKMGLSQIKVYEYLSCGKVTVGNNISGIRDLLNTFQVGIAVPPENPQSMEEAIMALLKNPILEREIGKRGRNLIVERFTWKAKAKEILRFAEKLLYDRENI